MDLIQRKLTKSEWEGIEVPVSADEQEILKLIKHGYSDIDINTMKADIILDDLKNPVFFICIVILISTLIIRQILMPRINIWRDAELAGDETAGHKFKIAHRLTVVLNIGQMIGLIYAVYFNVNTL